MQARTNNDIILLDRQVKMYIKIVIFEIVNPIHRHLSSKFDSFELYL